MVALLWAILFVLTFGLSSIHATSPVTPWITTLVVLLLTGILGRFLSGKGQN
jgi:hypothetical protein